MSPLNKDSNEVKTDVSPIIILQNHLLSNFQIVVDEELISPMITKQLSYNFQIRKPQTRECSIASLPSIYTINQDKITPEPLRILDSREIEVEKQHHSQFKPLPVLKVYGRNYTNDLGLKLKTVILQGLKQIQSRNRARRDLDVFDLVLGSLYPSASLRYEAVLEFPEGKTLYSYQQSGVSFLIQHKNALLADEMGLGKSIQAIIAARLLFKTNTIQNCLIVCPKSVITDWKNKFEQWAKELTVCEVSGAASIRRKLWMRKSDIYLVTYDTLREDVTADSSVMRMKLDLVILDEVQRIKNSTTQTFKIVKKLGGAIRWGLSGTPLENRVEDLTTIFGYLKPGLFRQMEVSDPMQVRAKVQPFTLRRTKSVVLKDLPEKIHNHILLDLTPQQRIVYRQTEQKGINSLKSKGPNVTVTHILALISQLKQICNFELISGESSKLEYLQGMLSNLTETGEKMIVFSQYPRKTLTLIERQLKSFRPLLYHGGLTQRAREFILQQFKENEKVKVLLISLRAGGLGLTLTSANYVTHFDSWWNPAVMLQAEDRTHRIGQTQDVVVTSLVTKNTIEERIQQILEGKQKLFQEVVGEISQYRLTNMLTEQELFGVFGLQKIKKAKVHDRPKP